MCYSKLALIGSLTILVVMIGIFSTPDAGGRTEMPQAVGGQAVRERCADCHQDQVARLKGSKHARLRCAVCHQGASQHQQDVSVLPQIDFRLESCGRCHQPQWDSYMKDDGQQVGPYGGSVKRSKFDEIPLYKKLLAGHGFTLEYNEDRAHRYLLKDHIEIKRRQNPSCLNCKSTEVAYFWGKPWKGITLNENANWKEVVDRIDPAMREYGIGCSHCHDPHATRLRVIRSSLLDQLQERGIEPYLPEKNTKDLSKVNQTTVCAQCHIEYVCGPGVDKVQRNYVPWRKLEELEEEYLKKFNYQQDWVHELTGIPLIKVQHPETEPFWGSVHHTSGVTCSDCHMPKMTRRDGRTYTSHWLTSPRKHLKESCSRCHTQGEKWLADQITQTQEKVAERMKAAERALSDAIDAIVEANKAATRDEALLERAKRHYQTAHVHWEWWSAENSMGFHNPQEALRDLGKAIEHAKEAQVLAIRAIRKG